MSTSAERDAASVERLRQYVLDVFEHPERFGPRDERSALEYVGNAVISAVLVELAVEKMFQPSIILGPTS